MDQHPLATQAVRKLYLRRIPVATVYLPVEYVPTRFPVVSVATKEEARVEPPRAYGPAVCPLAEKAQEQALK